MAQRSPSRTGVQTKRSRYAGARDLHDPWLRGSGSGAADLGTGGMSARAIEGARRAPQLALDIEGWGETYFKGHAVTQPQGCLGRAAQVALPPERGK